MSSADVGARMARAASFNGELVSRLLRCGEGLCFEPHCRCGKAAARDTEKGLTGSERVLLVSCGLTGEVEDGGVIVIRALIVKRRFECGFGHEHEIDFAVFRCPFGPAPHELIRHGWNPEDHGYRTPHCLGPLAPTGDYKLVPLDTPASRTLPRRILAGDWACPNPPFRRG
jgi:hypothetical protein